ncbi:MAG: hypothetical protein ACI9EW_002298 [Cellvibrionaceae bacterium]|jgi:hypothetical protein
MNHTEGMEHGTADVERQLEVAEKGHNVMPFDLDRSTHVFEKTTEGGIQQVLSDDSDSAQIKLIQTHLEEEYGRFQNGDFADPAFIHGDGMPGLAILQSEYAKLDMIYEPLLDGGQITYSTTDEALINAIHVWFEAQLADHGTHAVSGE